MAPGKAALVKGRRAIRENVSQGLCITTEWTSITDALTPALKIVKTRQGVYSGISSIINAIYNIKNFAT